MGRGLVFVVGILRGESFGFGEFEIGIYKYDIVVVVDGNVIEKDFDLELIKLNIIFVFYFIMRGSLNIFISFCDFDFLDKMGYE